jgi:predicted 3-demethylubiquinone-9 3-methyltransferase (glyoxalase superfamily)
MAQGQIWISWQIVLSSMDKMMRSGTKEQIALLAEECLKMKRYDLVALQKAYE